MEALTSGYKDRQAIHSPVPWWKQPGEEEAAGHRGPQVDSLTCQGPWMRGTPLSVLAAQVPSEARDDKACRALMGNGDVAPPGHLFTAEVMTVLSHTFIYSAYLNNQDVCKHVLGISCCGPGGLITPFPASSVLCPCQDHSPYHLGPPNLPEDKHWELCPTNCLSNICTPMLSRFNCV